MLVLHVHILGEHGNIERTYDLLRFDGKDTFEGCDIIIPYDKGNKYPIAEDEAISILAYRETYGDH